MIEAGALLDDRYQLEAKIGSGGTGDVWRARNVNLGSAVAVKVLHVAASQREISKQRFLREARVTAQLRVRQAVQVHDFGFTADGRPYLVMELLEGETLKRRLSRKGRLTARETVNILRQAARALDRAHELGIVHRDFKPDNVFVMRDEGGGEEVRVVDFGVAKLIGGFEQSDVNAPDPEELGDRQLLVSFTRTGGLLGTPLYMAPEQVRAAPDVGPEVDVWALGVVAYECLTGQPPFEGGSAGQLFRSILDGMHKPLGKIAPELPEQFEPWFKKACASDRRKRFAGAREAIVELEAALEVLPLTDASWMDTTDPHGAAVPSQPRPRQAPKPEAALPIVQPREQPAGHVTTTRGVGLWVTVLLLALVVAAGIWTGLYLARRAFPAVSDDAVGPGRCRVETRCTPVGVLGCRRTEPPGSLAPFVRRRGTC